MFTGTHVDPGLGPCKYDLNKHCIGRGSYSQVFEAKNKDTGMYYAAKQYQKRLIYGMEESLQSEFCILQQVSRENENILTLVDFFETLSNYYLVTDLALGGELFHRVTSNGPIPELETAAIIKTLLQALVNLHDQRIVHRDLKAENILYSMKNNYDPHSLLIADFGLAKVLQSKDQRLHETCGTLSYMAPELFNSQLGHSFAVDMWAIGVITYFMLCGFMPFDCETKSQTIEAITLGDYSFTAWPEYWDHISNETKDFINKCFIVDSYLRINANDALNHPFIRNLDNNNISKVDLKNILLELLPFPNTDKPSLGHYPNSDFSSANSTFSMLEKSRFAALQTGTTSQGAYCVSPELLSTFTSPAISMLNSRQTSTNDLSGYFKPHIEHTE